MLNKEVLEYKNYGTIKIKLDKIMKAKKYYNL